MDGSIVATTIHNNSVEEKPNPGPPDIFVDFRRRSESVCVDSIYILNTYIHR